MIIIDSNSQNLIQLLDIVSKIPNVAQVRAWPVLRQKLKDKFGDNAISLSCLFPHNLETDKFVYCMIFVTEEEYEDLTRHNDIIVRVKTIIDNYVYSNILPKTKVELIGEYLNV